MPTVKQLILIILFVVSFSKLYSQKNSCVIQNYYTTIEVRGNRHVDTRQINMIVYKRDGEGHNTFRIPYSKRKDIKYIKASILNMTGKKIRSLKKSEIITRSAYSGFIFYQDEFIKEFTLRHNEYPYIVQLEYQTVYDEFLSICDWTPVYQYDLPTTSASLKLELPEDYQVNLHQSNVAECKPRLLDGQKIYEWEATYDKQVFNESYAPSKRSLLPNVMVSPINFRYAFPGKQDSWEAYGNWNKMLIEGLDKLPQDHITEIQKLTKNLSPEDATRKLYHHLQDNMRYIAVSIDIGGIQPMPAWQVADKKYGDCKALSLYMVSALKTLNINASYVTIYSDDRITPLNLNMPGQQFNHVIVMVPQEKDTIWMECTSKNGPFNFVGTHIQDRYALVVNSSKPYLLKTPALKLQDVLNSTSYTLEIKSTDANLLVDGSYKGEMFDALLWLENDIAEKRKKEYLEAVIPYSDFEINNWQINREHRDSTSIELTISATVKNCIKSIGDSWIMKIPELDLHDMEKPLERKLPVQIDFPIYLTDTFKVIVPAGKIAELEGVNKRFNSEFGAYSVSVKQTDEGFKLIRSFKLYKGSYALDEYDKFYNFYTGWQALDRNNNIIIQ